jgi:phage tail-like protein
MAPVTRPDPYAGYSFLMTLETVSPEGTAPAASFSEISGIELEMTPIEYRNGSEGPTVRKMRGLVKYTNLTCKRGVTGDLLFWKWVQAGMRGEDNRVNGKIELRDEAQSPVMRWRFTRAWPCKFTGPSLNATGNEIAIDTMEICHEGIEVEQ